MRTCSAALVQMRAVPELPESVALAERLAREALDGGADLVVLPENHCGVGPPEARLDWAFDPARPAESPALAPFLALSMQTSAFLILGGVPERHDGQRTFNTLVVMHRGGVVATYRKIHMFDVVLPSGATLRESGHTKGGDRLVVLDTPLARIGLSVCYDLRFPELYRMLTDADAEVIVVPSGFTHQTGAEHWEPLLRARAIEAQAWVLAPAQHGQHTRGRHSWGHSMVVDPWGTVVAQASPGDQVVWARLDADVLATVRARLPALAHRRLDPGASAEVVSLTDPDRTK
jgi:predicted amidohydrolase